MRRHLGYHCGPREHGRQAASGSGPSGHATRYTSSAPVRVADHAAAYPRVLDELVPSACHITEQHENNPIEADHGRLTSRLRAMRGLKQLRCARIITAGHAFIQNIRRGHYELGTEETVNLRLRAAFDELVMAI